MRSDVSYVVLYVLFLVASIIAVYIPPTVVLFAYMSWPGDLAVQIGGLFPWVSGIARALEQCGELHAKRELLELYGHATMSSSFAFFLLMFILMFTHGRKLFLVNDGMLGIYVRFSFLVFEAVMLLLLAYIFVKSRLPPDAACWSYSMAGVLGLVGIDVMATPVFLFLSFSLIRHVTISFGCFGRGSSSR